MTEPEYNDFCTGHENVCTFSSFLFRIQKINIFLELKEELKVTYILLDYCWKWGYIASEL